MGPGPVITPAIESREFVRIDYDLAKGKILNKAPLELARQTLKNPTNIEQEMAFEINKTETHTTTWEQSDGFTISVGASFKGKCILPALVVEDDDGSYSRLAPQPVSRSSVKRSSRWSLGTPTPGPGAVPTSSPRRGLRNSPSKPLQERPSAR